MRRIGRSAPVAAAAALLVALAFTGERPEPGLTRFEPGGLMLHVPLPEISDVEIAGAGRSVRFRRAESGWAREAGAPVSDADAARLAEALKLLRDSPPERVLSAEELAGRPPAEFGLDPPSLTVTARRAAAPPFVVAFGGPNPLGLSRYARVEGRREIALVPGYVVRGWEGLIEK